MTTTTYTAFDLVQVPRYTAVGAMALGEQLISAAKPLKKDLSKGIARVLATLTSKHKDLSVVLRDRVTPAEGEDAPDTVLLDRTLDGCWGGLDGFLGALAKLPPAYPQVAEALSLRAQIVGPGGLKFLTLPYVLEWGESELRLQRIRKNGLAERIEALGGKIFLDAVTEAHAAYGKGLGVTAPAAGVAPAPPNVRDALGAFSAALRDYVVKVMGSVEPDEPATQALADKLLAPLAAWSVGPVARTNGKPSPAGEDAPTEDASAPPVVQ